MLALRVVTLCPRVFAVLLCLFSPKGIADEWLRVFFGAKPRTSIDRHGMDTA